MLWPAMNDAHLQFHYPARLSGSAASRVLARARKGTVAAVFKSAFYLETDAGWLCIGGAALAPSSLNLVMNAPAGVDWSASGVQRDAAVRLSENVIRIGNRFSFDVSDVTEWFPDPLPEEWDVIDLERGLQTLRELAIHRIPEQGLGRFVIPDVEAAGEGTLVRAAQLPIAEARRWLTSAVGGIATNLSDSAWIDRLVGLGPGLTPSGDDFVAGMMIALHALGETEVCRRLWAQSQPYVEAATNPISYAHLHAASHGEGSEATHRILNAIVAGSPFAIREHLNGIDRIGHSSGWDGLAGLVLVLDGWLRARGLIDNQKSAPGMIGRHQYRFAQSL